MVAAPTPAPSRPRERHPSRPGLAVPLDRRPRASGQVLLVEPDAPLAALLGLVLRPAGLRVATVADPGELAAWAATHAPAAVVVDTDRVALRAVAQALERATGPRPLVLLTGDREPTLDGVGRCPVVGWLRKPFAVAALLGLVRGALGD